MAAKKRSTPHSASASAGRDADAVVASLTTLEPERRDAVLEAARKLEILADALISHSRCAEEGKFEDVEAVVAIVLSVAQRQSDLAGVIVEALAGVSGATTEDLAREVRNG
jgi:hypothetical protein